MPDHSHRYKGDRCPEVNTFQKPSLLQMPSRHILTPTCGGHLMPILKRRILSFREAACALHHVVLGGRAGLQPRVLSLNRKLVATPHEPPQHQQWAAGHQPAQHSLPLTLTHTTQFSVFTHVHTHTPLFPPLAEGAATCRRGKHPILWLWASLKWGVTVKPKCSHQPKHPCPRAYANKAPFLPPSILL